MITDELFIHDDTRPLVLITGASRGIGRAVAERFAAEDWDMILCCRENVDALEETVRYCERMSDSQITGFVGDLGDPDCVDELFALMEEKGLFPNVFIHNAGITKKALLQDMSLVDWIDVFDTNVNALFDITRRLIPGMLRRGGGKILATSSVYGSVGASCEVAYSASKGAVDGFVRALAKELAPSGIQGNAVAPGVVDTDMLSVSEMDAASYQALENEIPAGRFGRPAEIAEVFWGLANAPEYLTGQIITVDGGWM
ncbi:MAG: SDR family oxidoreductase [Lachnospiraceae bacterium]|nr:SDR family oxidoreductase [Lachnospiraceae bacterium]